MSASRDFAWVVGGRLATAAIGLITIRCATNFLSPQQYGELALLVSAQAFCGLFLINPLGQHINRNVHAWWDEGSLLPRLLSYRWFTIGAAVVGGILIGRFGAQHGVSLSVLAATAEFAMVVGITWNGTAVSLLNMLGQRESAAIWTAVTVSVSLMLALVLVYFFHTAIAWFAGQAGGAALVALNAERKLKRMARLAGHGSRREPLIDRATALTYCAPLAVATGFMWLQFSGWRFVMEHYWGVAQLGYVAVGVSLASQAWTMAESLGIQFLSPLFFRTISRRDAAVSAQALSDLVNLQGPIYVILLGTTILGAEALLRLLVDQQYAGVKFFVILGAGIEFSRVLANVLSNGAQITGRTVALALPYACGALTQVALMMIAGVNLANIVVGTSILVLGGAVMLIMMAVRIFREIPFRVDWRRWGAAAAFCAILVSISPLITRPLSALSALATLIVIGAVSGAMILTVLWNNPAVKRLLAIQLS